MAKRKDDMDSDARWHLDKRIPIALIIALLSQTAGAIWWARGIEAKVEMLEKATASAAPQADRLTRVEVKLDVVQENLAEIKRLIQARR